MTVPPGNAPQQEMLRGVAIYSILEQDLIANNFISFRPKKTIYLFLYQVG